MPSTRRAIVAAVGSLGISLTAAGCAARRLTAGPKHEEYGTPTATPTRGTGDRLSVTQRVEPSRLDDSFCLEVATDAVADHTGQSVWVTAARDPRDHAGVSEPSVLVAVETRYGRHGAYQSGPSADFDSVVTDAPAAVDVTLTHEDETHECRVPVVVRHVDVYDT